MGDGDGDGRPDAGTRAPERREPPYQALFPNLDRVSRSSFDKGTISRRRVRRALVILALIPIIALAIILIPLLAPR